MWTSSISLLASSVTESDGDRIPRPPPVLDLLLTRGLTYVAEFLEVHQPGNAVSTGEAWAEMSSVEIRKFDHTFE